MTWDDLRNFLAIARHGSLSAAARALGVTQPTMGRRLAAMETHQGARLLLRTPEGFVLTPLGEQVLARAERMEEEMLAAERLISGSDIHLEGTVRLTTVDTLAAQFVTPTLVKLQCQHPGIAFELVPATQSLSLSRREADIAIRMGRFEGDLIVARKIGALALSFYESRDAISCLKGGQQRIVTTLEDQAHLPEAKWIAEIFPHAQISWRSNSREVQYEATCGGGGIAVLPRFRGDQDERLKRVRSDLPDIRREIWLGIHADLQKMPRMRATLDGLVEAFAGYARMFDPENH